MIGAVLIAIVILGFIFMMRSETARALSVGYVLGTGIGAIVAMIVCWDYVKDIFKRYSGKLVKPILQSAWPFAITGALGLLFTNMDILIISWIKTASDVGIYSAGIRIIQVLYLIPAVIQVSTLPIFARLAHKDNKKFREALEQTLGLLFLASIPMAIGGIILGTPIMIFIYGPAFASGGLAFRILLATLIIDFPGSVMANAIFVYNRQRSLIITSAIGGFSNVLFDLLLIPRWGMTGSAVATFIAQVLSNGYLWYVMKEVNYFEIVPRLGKVITASVIMGIVTLLLLFAHVNVLLNVAASTVVYALLLYLLREPLLREAKHVVLRHNAELA